MHTAIIGSGGVGGYLGAKLWKAGNEVVFVARGNHLTAMRQHGLRLESPDGNFTVHSTFTDKLDTFEPFDLIIISVKSFDTYEAAELALPVIKNDTIVLSVQNGIENENVLARILGEQHVIPGVAYIISTIASPGVIHHEGGTAKFKFGEMNGTISERCRMLEKTFHRAGVIGEAIENINYALWRKFIFICGLGGMTAYARKSIGEILADPSLNTMLQEVINEVATIGRAKGISEFAEIKEKMLAHYKRLPSQSTSSMHYDVTHGKRVEIEALNGIVVRFGKEFKMSTPANEKIYSALKQYA